MSNKRKVINAITESYREIIAKHGVPYCVMLGSGLYDALGKPRYVKIGSEFLVTVLNSNFRDTQYRVLGNSHDNQ